MNQRTDPSIRVPSTGNPSFIMTGIDRPDGTVRLYASRDLPGEVGWGQRDVGETVRVAWHLDADLENVLVIDAPTWGQAFAKAFEIWANADAAKHPRMAIGQKTELEAAGWTLIGTTEDGAELFTAPEGTPLP